MKARSVVILVSLAASGACGGGDSLIGNTTPVTVHARILAGTTAGATSFTRLAPTRSRVIVVGGGTPTFGNWLLTPNKLALTVTQLGLTVNGATTDAATVSCAATYDGSQDALTQLGTCDFTVAPGTYDGVDVGVSSTFNVTFNDAANGFYSTSSGIVTSPPAGGVQPLSVTLTSSAGNSSHFNDVIPFASPLTISDTSNVTVNIVIDPIQFFHVNVSSSTGAVAFGWPGTQYTDPFRPDLLASLSTPASVSFYSVAAVASSGSYCASACGTGSWPTGITSVAVLYSGPTTPAALDMQLNGTPTNCGPFGVGFFADTRSYLGQDASGSLGWAVPTSSAWTAYSAELRMATTGTVGGSTTLYCQDISADPKPNGGSFASGAPNIASQANSQGTFVLVGK